MHPRAYLSLSVSGFIDIYATTTTIHTAIANYKQWEPFRPQSK